MEKVASPKQEVIAPEKNSKKSEEEFAGNENDKEYMLKVLQKGNVVNSFPKIGEVLRNDPEFLLDVIRVNTCCFKLFAPKFRSNREIVLAAVRSEGGNLEHADDSFKSDKEVVVEAIKAKKGGNKGMLFADDKLKKERKFVLMAVKLNGNTLQYVGEEFKKDREIVMAAASKSGDVFVWADEKFKKDREIVLIAVERDGHALVNVDESFRKDPEVVLAAVKYWGCCLEYADVSLRKNRNIVSQAVKKDFFEHNKRLTEGNLVNDRFEEWVVPMADVSLQNDENFVLLAMTYMKKGNSFQFVKGLSEDRMFRRIVKEYHGANRPNKVEEEAQYQRDLKERERLEEVQQKEVQKRQQASGELDNLEELKGVKKFKNYQIEKKMKSKIKESDRIAIDKMILKLHEKWAKQDKEEKKKLEEERKKRYLEGDSVERRKERKLEEIMIERGETMGDKEEIRMFLYLHTL